MLLRAYGLSQVEGDRYAPGFVAEGFQRHGIQYRYSERDRTAIYLDMLSRVNAGDVRLLDLPELLRELRGIERRRGTSGRDRCDHRPGAHDDLAVSASGVLTRLRRYSEPLIAAIMPNRSGVYGELGASNARRRFHEADRLRAERIARERTAYQPMERDERRQFIPGL